MEAKRLKTSASSKNKLMVKQCITQGSSVSVPVYFTKQAYFILLFYTYTFWFYLCFEVILCKWFIFPFLRGNQTL